MAGFDTIIVPVTDVARARDFYRALLGVEPFADAPYYVGFMVEGTQLGLAPGGPTGGAGAIAYWSSPDIQAAVKAVTANGGTMTADPRDVGGGKLVATFTDPDGNTLGLSQDPAA
ncbi:VOC family protein [Arsenicicoccus piscis]|uniref:Glyoxalase n=1 Tax=Arsenicicoccus piscis TaxID=673954 RepID=A0ABQ6HSX0_9MICO|nr:VOC family protein [Arsenicicoccus piscis]MCH8627353.1 VOC family protein [Arsenicicoccus piscis]GMA21501.1 glyoxalase [Arsenicicoccus piscis]GMA22180.1 glyoxalase [Arsenicicoccus piscis]GMA22228.1 glyoxalase [Arsenicicoccus piscis]